MAKNTLVPILHKGIAYYKHHNLAGRDLTGAEGAEACMIGVFAPYAKFTRADLENANFSGANLVGADFTGANLEGANFKGAHLEGAIFDKAKLTGVNIKALNQALRSSPKD